MFCCTHHALRCALVVPLQKLQLAALQVTLYRGTPNGRNQLLQMGEAAAPPSWHGMSPEVVAAAGRTARMPMFVAASASLDQVSSRAAISFLLSGSTWAWQCARGMCRRVCVVLLRPSDIAAMGKSGKEVLSAGLPNP